MKGSEKQGRTRTADSRAEAGDAGNSALVPKTIRIDQGLYDELEALAAARGMSFGSVMRAAGEAYLAREQFAVSLQNVEANLGEAILAVMSETRRTSDDVQLIMAYLDKFAQFVMTALPEMVDKEGAFALGKRRHTGFINDFHTSFNNRKRRSKLSADLEETHGD